jgi:hypothetical protein
MMKDCEEKLGELNGKLKWNCRKEWIYPIEECMAEELERLAYFCGPNEKKLIGFLFKGLCDGTIAANANWPFHASIVRKQAKMPGIECSGGGK